jgi:hypothetical protein
MRLLHSFRWLLLALVVTLVPLSSQAGIFISVGFAPPVLPVYVQPVCPQPGLMWVPGYWAYGDEGYYWVPGAWVPSPYVGALWTPGYWGWSGGLYAWHAGYWGPHVGYYGGVNYGFGYGGIGFFGGAWRGGFFAYNTAVMHVGVGGGWGDRVYEDRTIVERNTIINNTRVSYNGGPGGINHQPAPEERIADRDQHTGPTSFQAQHENTFRGDHSAYAKFNGGHPQNTALAHPLAAENHPAPNSFNRGNAEGNERPAYRPETVNHANPPANERPMDRPETLNHGEGNPHPSNTSTPPQSEHKESKPKPEKQPKADKKDEQR